MFIKVISLPLLWMLWEDLLLQNVLNKNRKKNDLYKVVKKNKNTPKLKPTYNFL